MAKQEVTLKVSYDGPLNEEWDTKMRNFFYSLGLAWYAEGYNLETKRRDILFYLPTKGKLVVVGGSKKA